MAKKKVVADDVVSVTPEEKQIQDLRAETKEVVSFADLLEVTTKEDYDRAMSEGLRIKKIGDKITGRKEEITKPLSTALSSARELFRPMEAQVSEALATIKGKMLAWKKAEDAKAEEARRKLALQVEKGNITKKETIERRATEIVNPEKTTHVEEGRGSTSKITKYRVIDKTKVPLDYLIPDMVAIKNAFKMGKPVDGVEAYQEETMSFNAN